MNRRDSAVRLLKGVWHSTGLAVDALAFPSHCPICGADATVELTFCLPCLAELLQAANGPVCDRCSMPLGPFGDDSKGCSECRGRPLGFDRSIALGPYTGPIRHLCLMMKQERHGWIAPRMGEILAASQLESIRDDVAAGAWVVPVPLHWRRRFQRGYNQAEGLAEGVARALKLPVKSALRRVAPTRKLSRLKRSERAKVMKDAFRVRTGCNLSGRTILLVDDILTSGATAGSAARALKRSGAATVVACVVGRAEGNA